VVLDDLAKRREFDETSGAAAAAKLSSLRTGGKVSLNIADD
jgi:hypothetical protein